MPQKTPIIIASVLKPVDDSRMLYKLGFSIRETNKYDLNIIGFSSKKTPKVKNIRLIEIFSGPRTHPSRFLVPFKFLQQVLKIKPTLVIVTTFELLPVASIAKWFLPFKLVYDVQENYSRNITYNLTMPRLWRYLGSLTVKIVEKFSRYAIDHYLMAEKCYPSEMPVINNYTVIENKATISASLKAPFRLNKPNNPHFIISGTITAIYGTISAIEWFLALQKLLPNAKLTVVGHCPMASFSRQLTQTYGLSKGINLFLSEQPIPADIIADKIKEADILLLPYLLLPSIKNKIPTKLYEGIALQKVILMTDNPLWKAIVDKFPAGMCIDFTAEDKVDLVWKTLSNLVFYQLQPDESIDWEVEKERFQQLLQEITGK